MSNISDRGNRSQGEGGANKTKSNGSHLEQGVSGGAAKTRANGSHLEQATFGGARPQGPSGSHLQPDPGLQDSRGVRGAGGRTGHDRVKPSENKSGSNLAQPPWNKNTKK